MLETDASGTSPEYAEDLLLNRVCATMTIYEVSKD